MGIKATLSKPLAAYIAAQNRHWMLHPAETQQQTFKHLLKRAAHTAFGRDHGFADIATHDDFKKAVPIRDYEALRPYIDRITQGQPDIMWPGKPLYFAKTSGTTSGTKYIPISRESIPYHINSARNALLAYIHESQNAAFLDHKLIFLSGSPELSKVNGILTGRLSGISNHHVPQYLRGNQLPDYATNCIEDWEEKLERIIDQTIAAPMSLISGIPPWVQMYFDRIQQRTGKKIKDVFPHFQLFVYGGVNFEPYRARLFDSIGKPIDAIETYPASEGFIAYQNSQHDPALLALLNNGMFFEFVPADEYFSDNPRRLRIDEVELNKNYALIINSNAGLWGYSIGDTVKFVAKNPYKLLVTGRIKHFISAFGEHVIGEEVEKAMKLTLLQHAEASVSEFSVAPQVTPPDGLPYHEWCIAFERQPNNLQAFATTLDQHMRDLNVYYNDLITGSILRPAVVTPLQTDAFQQYMKAIGKLGGQNKVPRLANDRKIADALYAWRG